MSYANEFGRATELRDKLNELITKHGEDVRVAFSLPENYAGNQTGSTIGSVRPVSVELTTPPRIDLEFDPI